MTTVQATKQETLTLSAHTFADLLSGAAIAADSSRDAMPRMAAVYLSAANGELIATSTDRYRMAIGSIKLESGELSHAGITLADTKKILAMLKPYITGKQLVKQDITLARVGDILALSIGGDSVSVSLNGEKFPDYSHLMSDTFSPMPSVSLNLTLLASLAKIPHDSTKPVIVGFTGEKKAIQIRLAHDSIVWRVLLMPMRTA
jgi:DNA polymerase III sliding clamp (beta) subunit (PCNA family)